MTMRAHHNQIALLLVGYALDSRRGISLVQKILDMNLVRNISPDLVQIVKQPLTVAFRLRLLAHFAKRRVFRPERFDHVQYEQARPMQLRQIDCHAEGVLRAGGKIGGMENDLRREHDTPVVVEFLRGDTSPCNYYTMNFRGEFAADIFCQAALGMTSPLSPWRTMK